MSMDCIARVIRREGERALVRVARMNCAECGGCGLLARDREQVMEFTALNGVGALEGDEVMLKVPARHLTLSYLAAFGLPLLAMAAAYFGVAALFSLLGGGDGTAAGVAAAVGAGLLGLWGGVKLADRMGMSAVIVEVMGPAAEGGGAGTQGKVL